MKCWVFCGVMLGPTVLVEKHTSSQRECRSLPGLREWPSDLSEAGSAPTPVPHAITMRYVLLDPSVNLR